MRFLALFAFVLSALPAAAQQQPGILTLAGRAQTGADSREVRFQFICSENGRNTTGAFGVEIFIPRFAELAQVFDFDSFEGPDANAGARTRIEAGRQSGRFTVSGWVSGGEDQPFAFGLMAARRREPRRLAAVARVMRPLMTGSNTLTWTQESARPGGPPIVARFEAGAEDLARLRALLAPCLRR
jgi:hypothetical protein